MAFALFFMIDFVMGVQNSGAVVSGLDGHPRIAPGLETVDSQPPECLQKTAALQESVS